MDSYKTYHEEFVSNNNGTSLSSVVSCIFLFPVYLFILKLFQGYKNQHIIWDFILLMLPMLLALTVFADYNSWVLLCFVFIISLFLCLHYAAAKQNTINVNNKLNNITNLLTTFKG